MIAHKSEQDFEVLIVGGGPTGAIAALVLARAGVRVAVVEKEAFPRFQIGESFLPVTFDQLQRLGLMDRLRELPHMLKYGAEFGMGGGTETSLFEFNTGLLGGENETFNIARADFDAMLLEEAAKAGATLLQPAAVKQIHRLADGDVVIETQAETLTGRYLIDASGQATVVGRHLKQKSMFDAPHLQKVAYFAHFENVKRLDGRRAGYPTIAMADEGWFWIIPLNAHTTSVGMVLDPAVVKQVDLPARDMLGWGIARCPLMRDRMEAAVPVERVTETGDSVNSQRWGGVRADFSYQCEPIAGPGYFLAGDAATFLDPVFSTGVCLGMTGGEQAAQHLIAVLRYGREPKAARQVYVKTMKQATAYFTKVIAYYYQHSFRELFLHGSGPFQMQRSVLAVLTGHVFAKLPWKVRWRYWLFGLCVRVQQSRALVEKRERFSLLSAEPSLWQPSGSCVEVG
ncbi:MAG: NAD(P)/FAD-dependent oxidoreductase [Phycisphaeraceae bacterium]